tara:strand:- start:1858 stop:2535 length:678 start_codon:yes stop_codon:yes gene_type:complete
MKYIFVDIETKNKFLSGLDFKKPKGWLMSCFCLYNSYTGDKYYFVEDKEQISSQYDLDSLSSVKKDIFDSLYNFEEAFNIMYSLYEDGYILTSFNGFNFDYPIMSKPISEGGSNLYDVVLLFEQDNRTKDLFFDLNIYTEINFSLQNLIKGVIGNTYSKTMKSQNAPTQWAEGKFIEVLIYCMMDCIYTSEVLNRLNIEDNKYSINYKRRGKTYKCDIKNYVVVS